MNTQTGGEIAATDTNRKPDGDDRDDGGYIHREIAPRDRRDIPPPPRAVCLSFREADFAARPPCYR